jgi:hypothetical protein
MPSLILGEIQIKNPQKNKNLYLYKSEGIHP